MPRDHATPLSLVPGDRPVDGTATDPAEVALLTARPSADAAQTPGDAESSAWQDPAAEAGPTLPQGWWHGYGAADLFADLDRWTADDGAAGRARPRVRPDRAFRCAARLRSPLNSKQTAAHCCTINGDI